ncbi:MAG: 50S ribosomal protein L11 methyltransferase [Anaerolineaceae bacterium]|nr:50S ribosomal protein L11 methyltransferase [Anaerolineaceae bacterium]
MGQWVEVTLHVDGEAAEAVAQELQKFCHQGVSIEQGGAMPIAWDEDEHPQPEYLIVRGYYANDDRADETRQQIDRVLVYLNMMYPVGEAMYHTVEDEDWADAWKVHYKPVRLGKRILVRPRWIDVETTPDDVVISLDPGMAFGTGTHPTTQLCLEALEQVVEPGMDMLDLGCGSGILSIAAAKLGAKDIYAVDIDPVAVKTTIENAADNDVGEAISSEVGSLEAVLATGRQFDLVVVNILAKIIIPMCDNNLGDTVKSGGLAVFSGLIEDQTEEVEAALRKTGLEPYQRLQQTDWVAILAKRPE